MTAKDIQAALWNFCANHDYKLENTVVFNWESDFFSITKGAATVYEFEIKISRGDFFKDFQKPKHDFFRAFYENKLHLVKKVNYASYYYGDKTSLLFHIKVGNIEIGRRFWRYKLDETFIHEEDSFGYWMKEEYQVDIRHEIKEVHAAFTKIKITDLSKYRLPGKFFFACPDGLIKLSEVPDYAGLIYVKGSSARVVKPAPFLHKRGSQDLKGILMDKFYYLSLNQKRRIENLTWIINEYKKDFPDSPYNL